QMMREEYGDALAVLSALTRGRDDPASSWTIQHFFIEVCLITARLGSGEEGPYGRAVEQVSAVIEKNKYIDQDIAWNCHRAATLAQARGLTETARRLFELACGQWRGL